MSKKTKIVIDATSRMLYTSFYIKGLQDTFGEKNVHFSRTHFYDLERHSENFSFEHYFAFVLIQPDNSKIRIVIDYCDPHDINENAYEWCDFYAKINFNSNEIDLRYIEKIILIPPGFGIKIWNAFETVYHCFSNLLKCKFIPIVGYKRFFQDYYLQYKRPSLSDYCNSKSLNKKNPYIFMISTLWNENGEKTNLKRRTFIELTKFQKCQFEGGFFAYKNHPKTNEYKEFLISNPYSAKMYIEKTKQSNFVFNTPAVHNCHGWKLAEYLAMGKAIISTPLFNELTVSLENGKNIHIVSNEDELKSAIILLLNDKQYINKLSENATSYYEEFVHPKSVIKTILSRIPADICKQSLNY